MASGPAAEFFTSSSTVSILFFFLCTGSVVRRCLEFGNTIDVERLKSGELVGPERIHKRRIGKTAGSDSGKQSVIPRTSR